MSPKKRKTQLKKVERGYATTSIPKKAPPPPEVIEEALPSEDASAQQGAERVDTPILDECQLYLQGLVDKLQEKTEKEISRTLKVIEYDRRLSKSWPTLRLDEFWQDEVMRLMSKDEKEEGSRTNVSLSKETLLARIGILYGVLRRMAFQETMVIQCLNAIVNIDLDEALEWLFTHSSASDLNNRKCHYNPLFSLVAKNDNTLTGAPFPLTKASTPQTLITSEPISAPPTPKSDSFRLPISGAQNSEASPIYLHQENVRTTQDVPHLSKENGSIDASDVNQRGNGLFEEEEPNFAHALLGAKLTSPSSSGGQKDSATSLVSAQVNEPEVPLDNEDEDANRSHPGLEERGDESRDVFDAIADDEAEGSMFELLEAPPTEVTDTTTGCTIIVRDMHVPKSWTGRMPKKFLQEVVAELDRYAGIFYDDLSGGTRVKRVSVTVRWTGGQQSKWTMTDVACHDMLQAESYIATMAAHSLTHITAEGFKYSQSSSKAQGAYKVLPQAFRDLWGELEVKRKEEEDRCNRAIWSQLSDVVDKILALKEKQGNLPQKVVELKRTTVDKQKTLSDHLPVSAAQLSADFQDRQKSPSYTNMLSQRNALPIAPYRHVITEMLEMSQVMVLSGETGCGKSTQLPSFILEDQLSKGIPCKIVVTEPRRISAISLAQRVSRELGEAPNAIGTASSLVGYTIRLESHTSRNTRLNFVTNGIALRMLESGSGIDGSSTAFEDITHIVVDEVHERSIESDFLLIILKSLLQQRRNLKVILMSATLDSEKFAKFFDNCPTLNVPGRTYPVDVNFLEDAIEYSRYSISESSPYAKRDWYKDNKRAKLERNEIASDDDEDQEKPQSPDDLRVKYSPDTIATYNLLDEKLLPFDLIVRLLERMCFEDPARQHLTTAFLIFMPGLAEIRRLNDILSEHPRFGSGEFFVYPLHSTISSDGQGAVFEVPPNGIRKIVIATNIAETGITIPDITCVIDSGKHREMRYDEKRQISRLVETFVAKSNAKQRRGRAGRVQSGICFHLFSSARHDLMVDHGLPEMLRLSLSDLALRIKIMKINLGNSIEEVLSKALDPPSSINIQRAIVSLVEVKALTKAEDITPMGRLLSKLPTDVHLGKFLLIAALFRCLDPALTIAATLNSKTPFVSPFGLEREAERAKANFKSGCSDFLTFHNAFASWRRASANSGHVRKFCKENFLSQQNLQQIEELRQQFLGYLVDSSFIQADRGFVQELNRARYTRGRTRFVPVPAEFDKNSADNMAILNAALCAGLHPKLLQVDMVLATGMKQQMKTLSNNQAVFFHPSSVNFGKKPGDLGVDYIQYFTLMQSKKLYAWETSPVDTLALALLCGDCEFKLASDSIIIDRKIKYHVSPKTNIALKNLRQHLLANIAAQFRGKRLTEKQLHWNDVAMSVLGKVDPPSVDNGVNAPQFIVH